MKWFVTWNRAEYKEWAAKVSTGYLLLIIRKEKTRYLCVKADLVMGDEGLPDFKVIEQTYFRTKKEASSQLENWK